MTLAPFMTTRPPSGGVSATTGFAQKKFSID